MSKSTIAIFSAMLLSMAPPISTAWAEEGQAAPDAQQHSAMPPSQIEVPAAEAPDQDGAQVMPPQSQDNPDATEGEAAAQSQQPSAENPDGEAPPAPPAKGQGKYDKTSFFADFKQFHIGDIVPESYREPHYKIGEWKKRHLTAPEAGSHWTYMGGDYVLITDDEGKILKVLAGDIIYQ